MSLFDNAAAGGVDVAGGVDGGTNPSRPREVKAGIDAELSSDDELSLRVDRGGIEAKAALSAAVFSPPLFSVLLLLLPPLLVVVVVD